VGCLCVIVIVLHLEGGAALVYRRLHWLLHLGRQQIELAQIAGALRDHHWLDRFVQHTLLSIARDDLLLRLRVALQSRWVTLLSYEGRDRLQVPLVDSLAIFDGTADPARVLFLRHGARLQTVALLLLLLHHLLFLLLVSFLDLKLELLAVVVGDERGRDQSLRIELRRRKYHLVWRHQQQLILQVVVLLYLVSHCLRAHNR